MFEEAYFRLKKKIANAIYGFFIMIFNKIFTNLIFVILDLFEDKLILRIVKLTQEELNLIIDNFIDVTLINLFKNSFNFIKNFKLSNYKRYILKSSGFQHILLDKVIILLLLSFLSLYLFIYFCVIQEYFLHTSYSALSLLFIFFTNYNIISYKVYFIILFLFNLFIVLHINNHINNIIKDYIIDKNINIILSWLLGSFSIIVLNYYFSLLYLF